MFTYKLIARKRIGNNFDIGIYFSWINTFFPRSMNNWFCQNKYTSAIDKSASLKSNDRRVTTSSLSLDYQNHRISIKTKKKGGSQWILCLLSLNFSWIFHFDQNSATVRTPTWNQISMLPNRDSGEINVDVHPTDRTDYSFQNVSIAGREALSHKKVDWNVEYLVEPVAIPAPTDVG